MKTKKKLTKKKAFILTAIIIAAALFCIINNKYLVVTEYEFSDSRLENGFTIVQISDLHNASFGIGNKRLLAKIRTLEPDIIAVTGDLVDGTHTALDVGIDFCKAAAEICPTYYVTGNHEHWLDLDEQQKLYDGIRAGGTVILDDETTEVTINGDRVQISGLDDESLYNDDALRKLSDGFDRSLPVILLAHEPQYFEDYCKYSPDLVLTGHAHGGQVRLPFIGGLIAPDQGFFPKYTEGEFVSGNTHMLISRGLGNSVIPLRVFDLPEIVCVRCSV